jgi:hypothetical protein
LYDVERKAIASVTGVRLQLKKAVMRRLGKERSPFRDHSSTT